MKQTFLISMSIFMAVISSLILLVIPNGLNHPLDLAQKLLLGIMASAGYICSALYLFVYLTNREIKKVIVSSYRSHYENVYPEYTRSMFFLKLKYAWNGYRVWAFPTMWMSKLWYKLTKRPSYRGTNVKFERYVPGTDQITQWSPYDNFR